MIATASAVAFVVFSCKGKLAVADDIDLSTTPLQTVDSVFVVQSDNGVLTLRLEADRMEHYENDSTTFDLFPKGIAVYGYNADGRLESVILADSASRTVEKIKANETYAAFGSVVIQNVIKRETMETDTLYYDKDTQEIYTDCYVRMYSPAGFMQGYGMRSDDHARNSIIMKPFNSYGVVVKDSTKVVIDTVNFIGPMPK